MRVPLFFILALLFVSCRRDKLDGEHGPLAGKWRWIRLIDSSAYGKDTLYDHEIPEKIEWVFLQKGRYCIIHGGKKVESGYIKTSRDFNANAPVVALCKGDNQMTCTVYFHGNDTVELRIPGPHKYIRRWHVRD
jgi:hypothetical protein